MRSNVLSLFPAVKKLPALLFSLSTGAALCFGSVAAQAQTPSYAAFQATLGAAGTLSPDGGAISFPLFRRDLSQLTISLDGSTSSPAMPESVANGYIGLQQVGSSAGVYFVTGAFPALASELPLLESALQASKLPVTAIVNATAGLSQPVVTVHVEATMTESDAVLAANLAGVLLTIHSPQANVLVLPFPSPFDPNSIPAKFVDLIGDGQFTLLDGNTFLFNLPRTDAVPITIGNGIPAIPSLGVGQSIFISGNGYSVMNAELALRANEVAKVSRILIDAGFTLSAQSDYFVDDSKRLTFLHAIVMAGDAATFERQGKALGKALNLLK
ncbi:DUF1259 domain-containing protein [Granulicella arctica]|uniref:DUF1259 domain-containing protein n=1 Tax=Granulicella arctica TaxID=940613 RepID=UPI0021DF78DE|nr:DUF1259 domain-containing protein [Granulicella arctica]